MEFAIAFMNCARELSAMKDGLPQVEIACMVLGVSMGFMVAEIFAVVKRRLRKHATNKNRE